jgi:hypothetical protein
VYGLNEREAVQPCGEQSFVLDFCFFFLDKKEKKNF